ncbi:MAG: GDSL-type esterase/lipase family protein [Verrucomicrobia bacterium]|nr:GDSL-type esterase/lipase family protein [Verrucomicrobiota bacterium]
MKALAFVSTVIAAVLVASAVHAAPQLGDADFPQPAPSARHDELVAKVKSGTYDLAVIGDSITHTLDPGFGGNYAPLAAVWNKYLLPHKAINIGHNGYRTEEILWCLQNGELDFTTSPKLFQILIGTNNADDRNFAIVHTAEQILAGTKAIVDLIRQRHPTSKILILRIFPRGGDADQPTVSWSFHGSPRCIDTCRQAGELTRKLADGKHVFWQDLSRVFLNADGAINTARLWDLLHPGGSNLANSGQTSGGEAWIRAIEPTLARLMGDKPIVDGPPVEDPDPASP